MNPGLGTFLVTVLALAAVFWVIWRLTPPPELEDVFQLTVEELQYRLYCENCLGRDGARYRTELDRRGAPHVMPWTEPKGLI
jgi:hypothetical protein